MLAIVHYSKFRLPTSGPGHVLPSTDTQLAVIEKLLGANLPASFRDFLRVSNGGYPQYIVDVPTGSGDLRRLSRPIPRG
jgi:hypothetical protein